MKDLLLTADDLTRMSQFTDRFSLPPDSVRLMERNGVAKYGPRTPFLLWDNAYFAHPSKLLEVDEGIEAAWGRLKTGLDYLANPYTGYQGTPDITSMATQVFLAGNVIAKRIPEVRIILPPNIGFSPERTSVMELRDEDSRSVFQYGSWAPAMGEPVLQLKVDGGQVWVAGFELRLCAMSSVDKGRRPIDVKFELG